MAFDPGSSVLVRAKVSADGACVLLAPGVEVCAQSVDIVTDVPHFEFEDGDAPPLAILLFFASETDRQEFAEGFRDTPGMESREI